MQKKAFTLIEILIAIAAGMIITLGLYSTYMFASRSHEQSTNQQELAQNGRISLERISRDLRQTYEVVSTLPPNNTDPLNPPLSYIEFRDGHEKTKIQYIKYFLDGSNLHRQELHYYLNSDPEVWVAQNTIGAIQATPTRDDVKADKISSLKFYGNKMINIELQVSNGENIFNFKTEVLGRNI